MEYYPASDYCDKHGTLLYKRYRCNTAVFVRAGNEQRSVANDKQKAQDNYPVIFKDHSEVDLHALYKHIPKIQRREEQHVPELELTAVE